MYMQPTSGLCNGTFLLSAMCSSVPTVLTSAFMSNSATSDCGNGRCIFNVHACTWCRVAKQGNTPLHVSELFKVRPWKQLHTISWSKLIAQFSRLYLMLLERIGCMTYSVQVHVKSQWSHIYICMHRHVGKYSYRNVYHFCLHRVDKYITIFVSSTSCKWV